MMNEECVTIDNDVLAVACCVSHVFGKLSFSKRDYIVLVLLNTTHHAQKNEKRKDDYDVIKGSRVEFHS